MQPRVLVALVLLLALPFSGCLQSYRDFEEFDTDSPYLNPGVFEGTYMRGGSGTLPFVAGVLRSAVRPEVIILESDRPAYGDAAPVMGLTGAVGGNGDDARVDIVMAIWHPDNYTDRRPIIVDAGPYYEVFEHCEVPGQTPCLKMVSDTIEYPGQSTPMLLQNMLPRGYTIVQLAVRGTGTAGGCMDLMGPDEQADLDQALTWLGEQEWSNGRIGMMGVSYDGSTPWVAAATGNQYLKTIVPISGLPDIYDLMLHNGSAESRAALMHSTQVYWGYGFSDEFPQGSSFLDGIIGPPPVSGLPAAPAGVGQANGRKEYQDRQNLLCAEAFEGQALGQVAAAEGSRMEAASAYWTERDHRDDVLANYQGSVFLIHGLQDWNVDPHAAIPFNLALRAKGLEMKEWYGQWDHATPDSYCEPGAPGWAVVPCRMDYGEVLARWFDKYLLGYSSVLNIMPAELRGNETLRQELQQSLEAQYGFGFGDLLDTGPSIQVQDDLGFWRNADSFPPAAPAWQSFRLGADGVLGSDAAGEATLKASSAASGPTNIVQLVSEPFANGLHVSGMPQVKVPFTVNGEGGFLAAWLFDMDPNGLVRSPAIVQVPIAPDSTITTWKAAGIPVVGHAQMNLRYHAGGEMPQVLQPGERYVAQVEFEPLEVHIPEGHRIALWLFQYPYPDHSAAATPADVVVSFDGDAQLLLPTLELDPRTVFPVPGVAFPNSTVVPQMYVHVPVLDGATPPGAAQARPTPTAAASDLGRVPTQVEACLRLARCPP